MHHSYGVPSAAAHWAIHKPLMHVSRSQGCMREAARFLRQECVSESSLFWGKVVFLFLALKSWLPRFQHPLESHWLKTNWCSPGYGQCSCTAVPDIHQLLHRRASHDCIVGLCVREAKSGAGGRECSKGSTCSLLYRSGVDVADRLQLFPGCLPIQAAHEIPIRLAASIHHQQRFAVGNRIRLHLSAKKGPWEGSQTDVFPNVAC